MAKKKKEKTIYVDDGRSLADLSGIQHPRLTRSKFASTSTAKEKWNTYWNAVRMMFVPMIVTMTAIGVIYLIMWFVFLIL